jgi:hypothetical protein
MGKFTLLGIISFVCGFLLLGFQGISSLMGDEGTWQSMNLVDALEPQYLEWATKMPAGYLQRSVEYVITMPLFLLLFCVGVLCFVLGAFKRA